MKNIVCFVKEAENAIYGEKCNKTIIEDYEKELSLKFADDYKAYLENFTILALAGHELTGISKSERVDVKYITKREKERNINISNDMYVIEDANIDDIIIWQKTNGNIYITVGCSSPEKFKDSLVDYLDYLSH